MLVSIPRITVSANAAFIFAIAAARSAPQQVSLAIIGS